jgi:hypothetical protein
VVQGGRKRLEHESLALVAPGDLVAQHAGPERAARDWCSCRLPTSGPGGRERTHRAPRSRLRTRRRRPKPPGAAAATDEVTGEVVA